MSALESGKQLGPYEIAAPIGAGGMGEVYKARDTRLNRNVAIKTLPQHISERPEAKQRFKREAEMIAALNHPHICTLYDIGEGDGISFLVMELLEGETLMARLERGPLSLEQALTVSIQIADALSKAHLQGIIHRDLKPSNVMLTNNGVKLLDFGLAKLKQPDGASSVVSALPTNANVTAEGSILGTLQYMAPEQLEGQEADPRTDIFAFGAVMYEMVTGRKAFQGKSQVSLIGAILEREPTSITSHVSAIPPAFDRLIRRCLAKDPHERWQSVSDIAYELKWIPESGAHEGSAASSLVAQPRLSPSRRPVFWMVSAAVLFLAALSLGGMLLRIYRSQRPPSMTRFFITAPDQAQIEGTQSGPVISPDGTKVAFVARNAAGQTTLWVRALDTLVAKSLPGTDGAYSPFWSPDSRSLAFFAQTKLERVDVVGGSPQNLCDANSGRGGAWSPDGVILFTAGTAVPLSRVPAGGGQPVAGTKFFGGQTSHRGASFLPDGQHFLYFAAGSPETRGVYVSSLDNTGDSKRLFDADSSAIYARPGYLLFVQNDVLMRRAFDATKLELIGDAAPVADPIATDGTSIVPVSVSENDVLVYRNGTGSNQSRQLGLFDRTGKLISRVGLPGRYIGLDLSSDGKRLAVHRHDGGGGDIWLFELLRGTMSRFTFEATQDNSMPIWSPDGTRIVFSSVRSGKWGLYEKLANGSGTDQLLYESAAGDKAPMSWSPDGKYIVFQVTGANTGWDLWVLPLTGDRKAYPMMESPFNETWAEVSPDGKWIAYDSEETGRYEVYIRPFPVGEGKWQVSTDGGYYPRWRKDENELFYADAAGPNGKLLSLRMKAGSTPEFSPATPLFASGYINLGHGVHHKYAVSPDGQRFIIPRPESTVSGEPTLPPITVVLNWTSAFDTK